jgi:hypothetical protein
MAVTGTGTRPEGLTGYRLLLLLLLLLLVSVELSLMILPYRESLPAP